MIDFIILSRPGRYFKDLQASPYLEAGKNALETLDNGKSDHETVTLKSGRKAVLLRIIPFAVSSTDIRSRLQAGRSTKYLLPEQVESL